MMAGRPPKPPELKLIQGNPGHRPIQGLRPESAPYDFVPPPSVALSERGAMIWEEMRELMQASGIIKPENAYQLAAYCETVADYQASCEGLSRTGGRVVVGSVKDGYERNPFLVAKEKSAQLMRLQAADLGLTPAARSRVQGVGGERQENPIEAMLRRERKPGG
jgi:P27 family predicted phage terminase small subunit